MTLNQINGLNTSGNVRSEAGKASSARADGSSQPQFDKLSAVTDAVVLSEHGERLLALQEKLASVPEIDQQRVAAIRQAIADGNYQINADKLAERLIQLESILDR